MPDKSPKIWPYQAPTYEIRHSFCHSITKAKNSEMPKPEIADVLLYSLANPNHIFVISELSQSTEEEP